jgi:hypothetical protein
MAVTNPVVTGHMGIGVQIDFTTSDGGVSVHLNVDQVLDTTPPPGTITVAKWTPISGSLAGLEQIIAGKKNATQSTINVTYDNSQHAVLASLLARRGILIFTFSDGHTLTGPSNGALVSNVAFSSVDDSNVMKASLTFDCAAGFVYA